MLCLGCCLLLHALDAQETLCIAEQVKYVVLDEADKMLSLGLQPQLKRLRTLLVPAKKSRQEEEGAGVLVRPHTRRKRPQVLSQPTCCFAILPADPVHVRCLLSVVCFTLLHVSCIAVGVDALLNGLVVILCVCKCTSNPCSLCTDGLTVHCFDI